MRLVKARLTISGMNKTFPVETQTTRVQYGRGDDGLIKFNLLAGGSIFDEWLGKPQKFTFAFDHAHSLIIIGKLINRTGITHLIQVIKEQHIAHSECSGDDDDEWSS